MKIRRFKIMMLGPILLSLPMMCMHLGDDHHSGPHHSSAYHPSYQYSIRELAAGSTIESSMTQLNSTMAQEGTQTQPVR